jgi:hypothetical protein
MPQAKDKRAPKEETISTGPRRSSADMDPPPHNSLPDDEIGF